MTAAYDAVAAPSQGTEPTASSSPWPRTWAHLTRIATTISVPVIVLARPVVK